MGFDGEKQSGNFTELNGPPSESYFAMSLRAQRGNRMLYRAALQSSR